MATNMDNITIRKFIFTALAILAVCGYNDLWRKRKYIVFGIGENPPHCYPDFTHGKTIENGFPSRWQSICTTWRPEYKLDITPPPGVAH